jgi:hypothetical protein
MKQFYSLFSSRLLRSLTVITLIGTPFLTIAQAPNLGTASSFVLFTSNGAVLNTGTTHLTGNVGTQVGLNTGFGNVNGVMHATDGATLLAMSDLQQAYSDIYNTTSTGTLGLLMGNNTTVNDGVYDIPGNASLDQTLTLDAQGDSNAVFIFKVAGAFASTPASQVVLANGAMACNVFWIAEGVISLGTNSVMKGTMIAHNTAFNMATGARLDGRALSTGGAITVDGITAKTPRGCGSAILTGPGMPIIASLDCYALFSSNGPVDNAGITNVTGAIGTNLGSTTDFDDLTVDGIIHLIPDPSTATAAADLVVAYNYLNGLPYDIELLYPAQFGNSLVLTPHTYRMNAAATFIDTVFLDAEGNPNAVFVIQLNGALVTSTYSKVMLMNGAQASNVFWKVDGAVDINDYSQFAGTIISNGAISLKTGVLLEGRALTNVGALSTVASDVVIPTFACGPLSVSWLGFTGTMVTGQAVLEWTTTNEVNNDFFTLSKSNDGKTFEAVTTVEPIGGAQNFKHTYTYTDPTPYKYYRISQTDHNGVTAHYRIVALSIPQVTMDDVTFYPTPFAGSLTIQANDASDKNTQQLTLSDVLGKQVIKTVITQQITTLSTDLPAGIYYYRLSDNHGNVRSGKLVSAQ